MSNTFKNDLQRGISIENKLLNLIKNKYPSASLIDKYKGYDIWIPETKKSIEVKYDPMSNDTGNIVIEIEMFNKPSALMATEADYWVFYDDIKFVCIKPKDIIHCIFLNKLIYKQFVGNGDSVSKKAFLVPKDILFKYGTEF